MQNSEDQARELRMEELAEKVVDILPESAYYSAFGAVAVDDLINTDNQPNSDNNNTNKYNYVGGNPYMLPEQEWPLCVKHGPLMFLWSMTDQKHLEDPCIIQCFMCSCIRIMSYTPDGMIIAPRYDCKLTLNKYKGKYGCLENENINFCNWSNFGYLIRRFYPRSDIFEAIKPVVVSENSTPDDDRTMMNILNYKDRADKDAVLPQVWPKKYLMWKTIRILDLSEFPTEHDYILFPDGSTIYYDQEFDFKYKNERDLVQYALLHHTRGIVEQTDLSLFGDKSREYKHGYIVMMQYAKGMPVSACDNTAHLNISYDLIMRYLN